MKKSGNNFVAPSAGAWSFKRADIAASFDAHVREQLPWYDLATGVVAHIARHVIPKGGLVYDVGASTGNIGRALEPILTARNAKLVAVDDSPDMEKQYQGPGEFICFDVAGLDFEDCDLIVAFLILMFVPVAERAALIERMKAALRPGGALVVFDRLEPAAGYVGIMLTRLTLAAKYEAGAKPDEIIRKELSLAGVQRPMSVSELAGFQQVFRFGDFGGWIHYAEH